MVEAVAQKRALEGEGKAFVGVGGGGTSLDVENMGLGFTLGKPEKFSLHVHPGRACGNQDYCRSEPMVGATQVWCTNKDDLSLYGHHYVLMFAILLRFSSTSRY